MKVLTQEPRDPGFMCSLQLPCFHKMMGMYDQQFLILWELETPLNLRWKLQMLYMYTEIFSPFTKVKRL